MNENIIEEYKGYEILAWSEGFEKYFTNKSGSLDKFDFGMIAKFFVRKDQKATGFAFAVSGLDMFAEPNHPKFEEKALTDKALEVIRKYLDSNELIHEGELTFEFHSNDFLQMKNPIWWKK